MVAELRKLYPYPLLAAKPLDSATLPSTKILSTEIFEDMWRARASMSLKGSTLDM